MPKASVASLPKPLRNQLRGARDTFDVISTARLRLTARQMPALAKAVRLKTYQGRPAFPHLNPKRIEDLRRDDRSLQRVSLEKEVWWIASFLSCHSSRLNSYLAQKRSIEIKLWQQDHAGALDELTSLIGSSGASLWAIELQQAVIQLAEGLPAQKSFTRDIRSRRGNQDSVAYIAFYSSIRNENTTQIFSFVDHFSDRIRTNVEDESFKGWLLYRICDKWEPTEENTAALLRSENASSLIDIYETFMRLAVKAIAFDNPGARSFQASMRLLDQVEDARVRHVLSLDQSPKDQFSEVQPGDVAEAFYRNDFDLAEDVGQAKLIAGEADSSTLEYLARTRLHMYTAGKSSSVSLVVPDLIRLYGTHYEIDAFFSLAKLAINLRFTSIPATFEELIWDQVSPHPLKADSARLQSFLAADRMSKDTFVRVNTPDIVTVSNYIQEHQSISTLVAAAQVLPNLPCDLASPLTNTASQSLELGNCLRDAASDWDSVSIPLHLLQTQETTLRRRAQRLHARALLEKKCLHEAVQFIADSVLKDDALRFQLPVQEVCRQLDKAYRKRYAGDLSTSIVLDIACGFDSGHETIRAYVYEDLLHSLGFERPSQLTACVEDFERDHLVYYLRNLCKPEILERSLAFRGTSQVEDERIAICALLATLDPTRASEYEEETKSLTQRQVIRRGVMRIEESKIFVDTLGLARWAEKNLGESFTRYKALRNAGMDVGEGDLAAAIKQTLSDGDKHPKPLELPVNEAIDLMISMLQKLTHEYLTNPEHGLDYYLSMRIRHGAFSGQLRSPLEAQQIVTQRSSDSGEYKHNSHWRGVLFNLDSSAWARIDEALAAFTRGFDEAIRTYAGTFIQVNSDEKPQGLFRLPITNVFVALISSHIQSDNEISDFISACFEYLESVLDSVLINVRNHIDHVLTKQVNDLFVTLEAKLADFGTTNIHELDSAVRVSQTALAQSIVQLKNWFHRSESTEVPDWTFEQLVHIGLTSVTKMHDSFSPSLDLELSPLPRLVNLSLFADILFIVFDNIRVHSGLNAPKITVSAKLEDNKLRVKIVNELAGSVVTPEKRTLVDDIRKKVDQGVFGWGARREGGSGLMKLRNRIRVSEEDSTEFSFGLKDDKTFCVEFALPFYFVRRKEQM